MNIKVIKSKKFKDIKIKVSFLSELTEEKAIYKYLYEDLIGNTCEKYPTKELATLKQSELYSLSILCDTNVNGNACTFSINSSCINSSFINNEQDLLKEQIILINDFLCGVLHEKEQFKTNEFEEAKKLCYAKMVRKLDKPNAYCLYKAYEEVGKNQPCGFVPALKAEKFLNIDNQQAYLNYLDMLQNDRMDIIVCGDVEEKHVKALFEKYLTIKNSGTQLYGPITYHEVSGLKEYYQEEKNISQTYFTIMYAANIAKTNPLYYAYALGNFILGGSPSSLLFQEVREKHSLCYSINSTAAYFDSLMYITCGVEQGQANKAIELSKQQFEKIKHGDFDESLIETAKVLLLDSIRKEKDSGSRLISRYYVNLLSGVDHDYNQVKKELDKVDKTLIMEAFNKLEYLTTYVVGKE